MFYLIFSYYMAYSKYTYAYTSILCLSVLIIYFLETDCCMEKWNNIHSWCEYGHCTYILWSWLLAQFTSTCICFISSRIFGTGMWDRKCCIHFFILSGKFRITTINIWSNYTLVSKFNSVVLQWHKSYV